MIRPSQINRPIVISTPSLVVDPTTGNQIDGPPLVVETLGYLSQQPIRNLAWQAELIATQNTSISLYTLLVLPGTHITSASTVRDDLGIQYEVTGEPAERYGMYRRLRYIAAALRRISDMQEA